MALLAFTNGSTVPIGQPMPQDLHAIASACSAAPAIPIHRATQTAPIGLATRYLSSEEAHTYLGCHPRTLHRLIESGRLRAFRLGRLLKFRIQDLDAVLEPVSANSDLSDNLDDFIAQQTGKAS